MILRDLLLCLLTSTGCCLVFQQQLTLNKPKDQLASIYQKERIVGCSLSRRKAPSCGGKTRYSNVSMLEDAVRDYHNAVYMTNLTLGSEGQIFSVVFDTGSSTVWIPSSSCGESCQIDKSLNYTRKAFNENSSSSFHTEYKRSNETYGSGSVGGILASDQYSVGNFHVDGQDFLLVDYMKSLTTYVGDGLFALGYPRTHATAPFSPLELLRESFGLFSVYLQDSPLPDSNDGGTVTWGSLDPQHCSSVVHFTNLSYPDDPITNKRHYWIVPVSFNYTNSEDTLTALAAIDTGASAVVLPFDALYDFMEKNGADPVGGGYVAPCSRNFSTMEFVINGLHYQIPPEHYVRPTLDPALCVLQVSALEFPDDTVDILIGIPFFKSHCLVFDFNDARIGISDHAHSGAN